MKSIVIPMLIALAMPLSGCAARVRVYTPSAAVVVADDYRPLYYNGYVVYYDTWGAPIYYVGDTVYWRAEDARARSRVRPALFQSQLYWLEAYERSKLRNVMENAGITAIDLADAWSDRYYDAITVRIFASGLDFTIDESSGVVVSGSRFEPRAYSEYWTFVRSARGEPGAGREEACPNCGASLEIEMSGECKYCRAHVTSGEFDWVLSRIEQDESYGA